MNSKEPVVTYWSRMGTIFNMSVVMGSRFSVNFRGLKFIVLKKLLQGVVNPAARKYNFTSATTKCESFL